MTGAIATGVGQQTAASPVLAEWFLGWDESFGRQDPDGLWRYAQRLVGSLGTTDQEVKRQWLVLDWMVRLASPIWLRAANLDQEADGLEASRQVTDRRAMGEASEAALEAARAAQDAHEQAWSYVARLAQPDVSPAGGRPPWRPAAGNTDPRRVQAWGGLADGTRSAIPQVRRLVRPACRAVGFDPLEPGDAPVTWQALARAIGEAAGVIAWSATQRLVSAPSWSWHTPADDAWRAAHAAAGASLRPVEDAFVASAHVLVEEMFRVTEEDRCRR